MVTKQIIQEKLDNLTFVLGEMLLKKNNDWY
jgi:hypothetical protein